MKTLIGIDNGGTLTDAIAVRDGKFFRAKALTTPHDLSECFMNAVEALSEEIFGEPQMDKLLAETEIIRYSTTQGTNALVQAREKGPRIGLILSDGDDGDLFRKSDAEKDLFDHLIGDRFANVANEDDDQGVDKRHETNIINALASAGANRVVICLSGQDFAAREQELRRKLLRLFPRHYLGALPLLLSHEFSDEPDARLRGWSSILNSFLHPAMEHFLYNAENQLRARHVRRPLLIFRNDGNSTRVAKTVALKTYSSGPRGGMEGALVYAQHYGLKNVLTMDIGGTTTDIGLIKDGKIAEIKSGLVEGVEVAFPLCDMYSAGVGGSSVLGHSDGKITVGPQSVGAAPGPACFGYGGTKPTITDVFLAMGYFDPKTFFNGRLNINADKARDAIEAEIAGPAGISVDEALIKLDAAYHRKVADEIKSKIPKGSKDIALMAFGGAGAMSACKTAAAAGISTVIVPHASAVFCAYGLGFSNVSYQSRTKINGDDVDAMGSQLDTLVEQVRRDLFSEGFSEEECELRKELVTRDGDNETVQLINGEIPEPGTGASELRVTATRVLEKFPLQSLASVKASTAVSSITRNCLAPDGSRRDLPVYLLEELTPNSAMNGPALIEDAYSTLFVDDGWSFELNNNLDVVLTGPKEG